MAFIKTSTSVENAAEDLSSLKVGLDAIKSSGEVGILLNEFVWSKGECSSDLTIGELEKLGFRLSRRV